MTQKIKCPRCDEVGMAEITKHLGQNKVEIYCNSCGTITVTNLIIINGDYVTDQHEIDATLTAVDIKPTSDEA